MNEEENKDRIDILKKIHENYKNMNKMMVEELEMSSTHGGLSGSHREEMWIDFFERIIPKKFSIDQGVIIMDSYGKFSREVDICVYDNTYTPYVFRYNNLKFIPIEAVAMVVESKSTDWDDDGLRNWAESINILKTNRTGLARMVNGYCTGITNKTQSSTQPLKILVSIKQNPQDDTVAEAEKYFDFIITKSRKKQGGSYEKGFEVTVPNETKSLYWWGEYMNKSESHRQTGGRKSRKEGVNEGKKEYSNEDSGLLEIQSINKDDVEYAKSHGAINISNIEKVEIEKKYDIHLKFEIDDKKNSIGIVNTLSDLRIKNNPILTLNFQINQLLMLINNPMLFPHFAYANMFNKKINELEEKKNKK